MALCCATRALHDGNYGQLGEFPAEPVPNTQCAPQRASRCVRLHCCAYRFDGSLPAARKLQLQDVVTRFMGRWAAAMAAQG